MVRHGLANPGGLIPAGMYRYPTRFTATISVLNHSEPSGAGTNVGPRDMVKMGLEERSAREVASRLDICVHFYSIPKESGRMRTL